MIDLESWAKQYDKNGRYLISVKPSEIDQASLMKLKQIVSNLEWFDVQIFVFFGEYIHTLLNYLITYVLTMSASSYCTDVVYKAYLLERTSVLETGSRSMDLAEQVLVSRSLGFVFNLVAFYHLY